MEDYACSLSVVTGLSKSIGLESAKTTQKFPLKINDLSRVRSGSDDKSLKHIGRKLYLLLKSKCFASRGEEEVIGPIFKQIRVMK